MFKGAIDRLTNISITILSNTQYSTFLQYYFDKS